MLTPDDLIGTYLIDDAEFNRPSTWQFKVLLAIADRGAHGMTDLEVQDLFQAPGGASNLRARRNDLMNKGYVKEAGTKRKTPSGASAKVWVLGDSGAPLQQRWITRGDFDNLDGVDSELGGTPNVNPPNLRARLALIARRVRALLNDSGIQVDVFVDIDPARLVIRRAGDVVSHLTVTASVLSNGLKIDVTLQAATSESDGDFSLIESFRQSLATAPPSYYDAVVPLQDLNYISRGPNGLAITYNSVFDWVDSISADPLITGTIQKLLSTDDVDRYGSALADEIEPTIAAFLALGSIEASPRADPILALVQDLFWSEDRARHIVNLARRSKQLLFSGPPGTGKTFAARILANALTDAGAVKLVQFHPTYAYEDFVEGIRPVLAKRAAPNDAGYGHSSLEYEVRQGSFLKVVESAVSAGEEILHIMIIDEINRANLSQVLGELLFALEYRGEANAIELPYSGRQFFVPKNLLIIGTMNTADRSISIMDAATRRRFRQVNFGVDYDALHAWHMRYTDEDVATQACERLKRLNEVVADILDEDRMLGHSFLMRMDVVDSGFGVVWEEELEPVLRDHLFGRYESIGSMQDAFLGEL